MSYAFLLALYPFLLGCVQSANCQDTLVSIVIILTLTIIQINCFYFVISFDSVHLVLACAMWFCGRTPKYLSLSFLYYELQLDLLAFTKRKEKVCFFVEKTVTAQFLFLKSYYLCFLTIFEHQEISTVLLLLPPVTL